MYIVIRLWHRKKTERSIRKLIREAKEEVDVLLPSLSDFSSNEEMGEPERIPLGDYMRLDNIIEVTHGFQPANPIRFDIKHSFLFALRDNQFRGSETEDGIVHLNHFSEACITINPTWVTKSDKRLHLFINSISGRAKDWLNALPSGTIASWDDLKKAFVRHFFLKVKFLEKGK